MTTRKAPDNEDENPMKRRRVVDSSVVDSSEPTNIAAFDDVNEDCLVKILSYLVAQDMNIVAMCSRSCREARRHESLDQTRTGTIVCSERSTIRSLYNAIVAGNWNSVFSGNRTHLKIENIANLSSDTSASESVASLAALSGVTSLDLSYSAESTVEVQDSEPIRHLLYILPNLREVDLSHVKALTCLYWVFGGRCPGLARITGKGSDKCIHMSGSGMSLMQNITELYLDGSCLLSTCLCGEDETRARYESTSGHYTYFLFEERRSLERLSIKGASWVGISDYGPAEPQPITQAMLMKMVRNHSNLRWLQSDLTEENVAILKSERPEITFVS